MASLRRRAFGELPPGGSVYVPPKATPPISPLTVSNEKYESFTAIMTPITSGIVGGPGEEFPFYTTTRAWKACDVYVTPPAALPTDRFIRIRVYAVIEGVGRALVASGYYARHARSAQEQVWICAARARCARFEITYSCIGFPAAAVPLAMPMTVIASDDASPPPPTVGVCAIDDVHRTIALIVPPAGGAVTMGDFATEIVKAVVTNTTAGALFFQAVDAVSVGAAAGLVPYFSITIPANSTVILGPEQFSGYRFGLDGLVMGGSTTVLTFTAAAVGAVVWNAWIR